jgi:peptide/nickel transport system ATP-binding protein
MTGDRTEHTDPVLKVEGLSIAYQTRTGPRAAVRGVSFEIGPGEVLGLAGESGSGKSTVAFGLVGYLGSNGQVTQGSIQFLGRELTGCSQRELGRLRGDRMAMVFQDPMAALNPALRVGDQLTETLIRHRKSTKAEARRFSLQMLERVHLPDPARAMRRFPHQLSGGQQQRALIAMALLNRPALLIMDEPTTALDVTIEAAVLDLVAELTDELDTSILFISHDLAVMARVCDRLAIMYAGQIVEQAPVAELFARPVHPYTRGLLDCLPRPDAGRAGLRPIGGQAPGPDETHESACAFHPRCKYAEDVCRTRSPELIAIEAGHQARCFLASRIQDSPPVAPGPVSDLTVAGPDDGPLIEVDGLQVYYRGPRRETIKAVDGVDLRLGLGQTLGLVGESGCGKSTLARAIIGLEKFDKGRIEFLGVDVGPAVSRRDDRSVKEMQMIFQNPDSTLNPAYGAGRQIGRALTKLGGVGRRGRRAEVLKRLESVRLGPEYFGRKPRSLSGGEKQRVAIARALAGRPGLVLCDEPVSSLDVSVQAAVLKVLQELQAETGTGLIFISHDLSVVRYLAHQVAVMYLGKIVEAGPTEAVFGPPRHPYTEALLSAAPIPDPASRPDRIRLEGDIPSPAHPPPGCPFNPRCPRIRLMPDGGRACRFEPPPWRQAGTGHGIRCHLPIQRLAELGEPPGRRP